MFIQGRKVEIATRLKALKEACKQYSLTSMAAIHSSIDLAAASTSDSRKLDNNSSIDDLEMTDENIPYFEQDIDLLLQELGKFHLISLFYSLTNYS
jgi:hypothetical protein